MKNNKIDFAKLQTLRVEGDILKAGFSQVLSGGTDTKPGEGGSNTGNCVSGCTGTINRFICVSG